MDMRLPAIAFVLCALAVPDAPGAPCGRPRRRSPTQAGSSPAAPAPAGRARSRAGTWRVRRRFPARVSGDCRLGRTSSDDAGKPVRVRRGRATVIGEPSPTHATALRVGRREPARDPRARKPKPSPTPLTGTRNPQEARTPCPIPSPLPRPPRGRISAGGLAARGLALDAVRPALLALIYFVGVDEGAPRSCPATPCTSGCTTGGTSSASPATEARRAS